MTQNDVKLFAPGPTYVKEEILQEMSRQPVPHRSEEFSESVRQIVSKLRELLYTQNPVYLSTSSSTGLMEAAIRNCVRERCLNLVCGAFGERWHQIALACNKKAEKLEIEWGRALKPEMLEKALSDKIYDAVTLVHNETSTGVVNPIYELAEVMKNYPEISFLVDCVSSMACVKIEVDKLGIDVCLAGVQKGFALPPGLAVCSVSDKALQRAGSIKNRGVYFDFIAFQKNFQKNQTPHTPSTSHIYALKKQMDCIFEEGLANRFSRHKEMADMVRTWGKERFKLFAEEAYYSDTVTCIRNTEEVDIDDLNVQLRKRGMIIANGYGKLKDKTFRIGHMGDLTVKDIQVLLSTIDEVLP